MQSTADHADGSRTTQSQRYDRRGLVLESTQDNEKTVRFQYDEDGHLFTKRCQARFCAHVVMTIGRDRHFVAPISQLRSPREPGTSLCDPSAQSRLTGPLPHKGVPGTPARRAPLAVGGGVGTFNFRLWTFDSLGRHARPSRPYAPGGRRGLSTFDFGLSTPLDGTPASRALLAVGGRVGTFNFRLWTFNSLGRHARQSRRSRPGWAGDLGSGIWHPGGRGFS